MQNATLRPVGTHTHTPQVANAQGRWGRRSSWARKIISNVVAAHTVAERCVGGRFGRRSSWGRLGSKGCWSLPKRKGPCRRLSSPGRRSPQSRRSASGRRSTLGRRGRRRSKVRRNPSVRWRRIAGAHKVAQSPWSRRATWVPAPHALAGADAAALKVSPEPMRSPRPGVAGAPVAIEDGPAEPAKSPELARSAEPMRRSGWGRRRSPLCRRGAPSP